MPSTRPSQRRHLWVFDAPIVTDWLFAWAVVVAVIFAVEPFVYPPPAAPEVTATARTAELAVRFVAGLLLASVVLGSCREYVRGRRRS